MPLFSTRGAGSAKAFGLTSGAGPFDVDYLVVAGAGSSARDNTGGGGAGGFRFSNQTFSVSGAPAAPRASATGLKISTGSYPITIGAGGAAIVCNFNAFDGTPSVFSTITSTGGGGGNGCAGNTSPIARPGNPGGSGGGAGQTNPGYSTIPGGTGNSPPTSPAQGSSGGATSSGCNGGAGGGGAMAAGDSCGPKTGGAGAGVPTTAFGSNGVLCGSFRYYAGGGGGGGSQTSGPGGPGGIGGGGNGKGGTCQPPANPGTANTGGGAGGAGQATEGGNGGSGIVVIRAPAGASSRLSVSPGTNTKTTSPDGATILTFTVTGTLTVL